MRQGVLPLPAPTDGRVRGSWRHKATAQLQAPPSTVVPYFPKGRRGGTPLPCRAGRAGLGIPPSRPRKRGLPAWPLGSPEESQLRMRDLLRAPGKRESRPSRFPFWARTRIRRGRVPALGCWGKARHLPVFKPAPSERTLTSESQLCRELWSRAWWHQYTLGWKTPGIPGSWKGLGPYHVPMRTVTNMQLPASEWLTGFGQPCPPGMCRWLAPGPSCTGLEGPGCSRLAERVCTGLAKGAVQGGQGSESHPGSGEARSPQRVLVGNRHLPNSAS